VRGGGLSGTVSAIDPVVITVTTQDGSELQVTTTAATTYHQQVSATPDALTVGAPVRVTVPGVGRPSGLGGGLAASPAIDGQSAVATEVELLLEAPAATTGGRGARLGGLTGTVAAIDDSSITVTTADGQRSQVATDAGTAWVQQTVVARDAITPGVSVRFTIEGGLGGLGGGPGQGQGQPSAGGQGGSLATITVSDVEVLLPASQAWP
jgi:preprotein translocase subunit YajC